MMAIADLMKHSIAIQSKTRTDDNMAGYSESLATTTTVNGAIFPATPVEREEWSRLGVVVTHRVYFPAGTTVTEDQELLYGSRRFDVKGVSVPGEFSQVHTMCAHVKVFAEEVAQ